MRYSPAFTSTHCAHPLKDGQAELTWLVTSRCFSRPQYRRLAAPLLTGVVSALQVDEQKSSVGTGATRIDVRVTSIDDDVTPTSGRACAVRSGMPATCSPTITLLQKRRGSSDGTY